MKRKTYNDFGQALYIEVEESFVETFDEMESEREREYRRDEWRKRNYLNSIDSIRESGHDIVDDSQGPDEKAIENEEYKSLHSAIKKLRPKQQELVQRIYFNEEKARDIAEEWGVTESAISHQMATILNALKKYLKNF